MVPRNLHIVHLLIRQNLPDGQVGFPHGGLTDYTIYPIRRSSLRWVAPNPLRLAGIESRQAVTMHALIARDPDDGGRDPSLPDIAFLWRH
jgi:hypothetical protein